MSFWDKIFSKVKSNFGNYSLQNLLSGSLPVYSNGFGDDIYASDVVQQAIYSIVTEMKKLDMTHIRQAGSDIVPVTGTIQECLDNPNPLMTASDYIEKITWQLLLNFNSFIYPIWNGDKLEALYPLQPSYVEFSMDEKSGEYFVMFRFPNGYEGTVPYSNIIHLRYHYGMSEYMGGDKQGQPNYKHVLDTLKINDTLMKGLAKSLNIQTSVNGIIKMRTMANTQMQMDMVREFEQKLQENKSGLLPIDIANEYVPITKQVALLDQTVLKFLDEKILRTWGVPVAIVTGDYTKEQYEAFYQKALEPLVKMYSEAHTKGIFSTKTSFGFGNKIMFYPKDLIFMNTSQKLEMVRLLGDSGSIYENEKRVAFGLKPLEELSGVRMMSLNYINVKDSAQYQTGEEGTSNEQ